MRKSASSSARRCRSRSKLGDLVAGLGDGLRRFRLDHDLLDALAAHGVRAARQPLGQREARRRVLGILADGAAVPRAAEAVLDGRPGREDDVVLVRAQQVGALLAQHADDLEGHVLDADLFADRVAAAEKFADQRLADQADFVAAEQFALVEDPPQLQIGPVPHLEKLGRAARHVDGVQLRLP